MPVFSVFSVPFDRFHFRRVWRRCTHGIGARLLGRGFPIRSVSGRVLSSSAHLASKQTDAQIRLRSDNDPPVVHFSRPLPFVRSACS